MKREKVSTSKENANPSSQQLISFKIFLLLTLFGSFTNLRMKWAPLLALEAATNSPNVTRVAESRFSNALSSRLELQRNVELGVERLRSDAREEFLESLPILNVSPKHTARFECELGQDAAQIDTTKLVWLKLNRSKMKETDGREDISLISLNQKLISPDRRFRVFQASSGRFQLTLENVNSSDHLAYFVCQIGSNLARSRSSGCGSCGFIGGGRLNVLAPPRIVGEETSASLVLAREFEPLTLHCKILGDPHSQVTWKREDSATLEGTEQRDKHELVSAERAHQLWVDSSELFFANFTRHQAGAYLCIASNGVQPGVSQRVYVQATACRASYQASAPSELCLPEKSSSELVIEVTTFDGIASTSDQLTTTQKSTTRKVWRTRIGEQTARASRTRTPDNKRLVNVTSTNDSPRNFIPPNWQTLVALCSTLWMLRIH